MPEDTELLRRYAAEKSEAAFAELMVRRFDLVHSAARTFATGRTFGSVDGVETLKRPREEDLMPPGLFPIVPVAGAPRRGSRMRGRPVLSSSTGHFRSGRCMTWFALGAVLLGGCAERYEVTVDSLAKPKAEAISYSIRNINPSVEEDGLRYREAEELIRTALSGRGLYEAPAKVVPDMIVDIDYGVGPPKVQREWRTEPVYRTAPSTIGMKQVAVGTDSDGRTIYENIPWTEPGKRTKVGDREYEVVKTTYEKYVRLTARENVPATEGRPPAEIWTVDITSEGESHDLRKYLPILTAASIDYIGKDTHGQKSIRLKDSDADVAFVKKGMGEAAGVSTPAPSPAGSHREIPVALGP